MLRLFVRRGLPLYGDLGFGSAHDESERTKSGARFSELRRRLLELRRLQRPLVYQAMSHQRTVERALAARRLQTLQQRQFLQPVHFALDCEKFRLRLDRGLEVDLDGFGARDHRLLIEIDQQEKRRQRAGDGVVNQLLGRRFARAPPAARQRANRDECERQRTAPKELMNHAAKLHPGPPDAQARMRGGRA